MKETIDGNIPVTFLYTPGMAGEVFLKSLKNGRIIGNKCKCGRSYLPPRFFCEECFSRVVKYFDAGTSGKIHSFTIAHSGIEGQKVREVVGMIEVKGGILMHRLSVPEEKLKIGTKVRAVFRAVHERRGSINDIAHFEAV